jgi:hypothetical protein
MVKCILDPGAPNIKYTMRICELINPTLADHPAKPPSKTQMAQTEPVRPMSDEMAKKLEKLEDLHQQNQATVGPPSGRYFQDLGSKVIPLE